MSDVVQTIKLFRPQNGDIIVVDFNKVNMTQVENAVKDLKVPVIGVHDLTTIQLVGMREQVDFSEQVANFQQLNDNKDREILRLNRIIKDDMVPKPKDAPHSQPNTQNPIVPAPVGNLGPKVQVQPVQVPVTNKSTIEPVQNAPVIPAPSEPIKDNTVVVNTTNSPLPAPTVEKKPL